MRAKKKKNCEINIIKYGIECIGYKYEICIALINKLLLNPSYLIFNYLFPVNITTEKKNLVLLLNYTHFPIWRVIESLKNQKQATPPTNKKI